MVVTCHENWKQNLVPLREQQMLLTANSSLQAPQVLVYFILAIRAHVAHDSLEYAM